MTGPVRETGQPAPVDARVEVPWLVRLCAYAIPLCVFPSSLWRLIAIVPDEDCWWHSWDPVYITLLSLMSMTASVLCVGLVQRWGEVAPGWLPVIGGRSLSVRAVTGVAATGLVLLALLFGTVLVTHILGLDLRSGSEHVEDRSGCPRPEDRSTYVLIAAAYAPLPLWPPLLAVVLVAYYRRRTR